MEIDKVPISIISYVGAEPADEKFSKSAQRFKKMLDTFLCGHKTNPIEILKEKIIQQKYDGLISLSSIEFTSMCAHHFVPFFGTVDILYHPDSYIVGIGGFADLIASHSKRLQLQEDLTKNIAESIFEVVKPRMVKININARHFCLQTSQNVIGTETKLLTEYILKK